jgi:signal transduction histidine kinase
MCWALALHLPAIVGYAAIQDVGVAHGLLVVIPPALLFAAATVRGTRRIRALAASLGLLCCSVVLVHLSNGIEEFYFHFFVVVALVALYEDWAVYLLAIGFVFVANLAIDGLVSSDTRYDFGSPLLMAAVNAAFVFALACAQLVFWHYNEQSRRRVEHYRAKLYEGQQSLMARLEETDRIRSDLVATVSHEFRTPLTGIRGTLLTIKRRRSRLSDAQLDDMIDSAVSYSDRLSRLLENMLTAATASGTDESTVADLAEVVADVLTSLRESPAGAGNVIVDLPPQVPVRMSRQALHQVVANLIDNAITHSWLGAPVRLIAGRVGDEVVLRIRNPGPDLDPGMIHRLFEPFTQRDCSATREADGAGMGLYVVRRLVEVHGGRLRMSSQQGEIIVEVDLCAAAGLPTSSATSLADPPAVPAMPPLPRSLRSISPASSSGPAFRPSSWQPRVDEPSPLPINRLAP